MQAKDVAEWMRVQYETVHKLANDLRTKIAESPRGDVNHWLDDLRARFGRFQGHVTEHMRIEEDGGYLKPVLENRPTLARQVDLLRDEHRQICVLMREIADSLGKLTANDHVLMRHCGGRIKNILSIIERHEDHENHMVLYSLNQELTEK